MIFLTGMPGSGKSYWAEKIVGHYQVQWVDTDSYIVETHHCSITEFFEQKGEAAFRQAEVGVLQKIITDYPPNTIVSCGGGLVVKEENRKLMKSNGCVVYLHASVDELAERLADSNDRPLLSGSADLKQTLHNLYQQRKAFYEDADYTLSITELNLNDFIPIINQCIK